VAPVLAVLPFAVMLVTLGVQRPPITSYGDRAITALEVRDLMRGRQLLGAYSRFGWHHPGPAFLIPLAAADVALGRAHWALDAGMLAAGAAAAAALVWVVGRAAGWLAAWAAAGTVGLYVHAVGPAVFRDPWNPWATLLPLGLLTVLCGAAGAGSIPALAASVVVASVIIQTHLAAAPVALGLVATAAVMAWWIRRREGSGERAASPWRRPAVLAAIAVGVAVWVPPLIQEATGDDPNLSDLWRFFVDGHPGHSLSTAMGAVGDRLGQLPFGSPTHFMATTTAAGWGHVGGALTTVALYLVAGVAVAVLGHRRGDGFARALGVLTVVAIATAVLAVHTAAGPLQAFVIGWVTAIPIGCWMGVASLLLGPSHGRRPAPGAPRPAPGSRRVPPALAAAAAGALVVAGTAAGTAAAAAAPSAATETAPQVTEAWAQLRSGLAGRAGGSVLLLMDDPGDWPVQAGLALELEEHGWRAHVGDEWVFMLGPARRETGHESLVATLRVSADGHPTVRVTSPLGPQGLRAAAARVAAVLGTGPA